MQLWQKLLRSIDQHSLTRPTYKSEAPVRELIRSKPDPNRLGYAVVAVKEEDIMKLASPSVDPLGHELVTLREHAAKLENIIEFVHANKKHYIYKDHTLTQVPSRF